MKTLLYIFILCLTQYEVFGQERFVKILDFDNEPQYANEILNYNGDYYLNTTGVCVDHQGYLTEACSGIIKLDKELSIQDSILIKNFSIGVKSILIDSLNDQFVLCGEDHFKNKLSKEFIAYKFSIGQLKMLEFIKLSYDSDFNRKYFQITSDFFNDYLFIGGTFNELDDSKTESLLFFLNHEVGDTSIILNFEKSTSLWNSLIDKNNQLNLALISHQTGGYNKIHIVKFDEDLNQVWHWTAENVDYIQKPYICELHDARLVVTVSDPVAPKIASLEAINPDKSRSWKYRFPDISGKIQRRVYRIKTLKNGDIVGMGSYGNNSLILDARIPEIPYIFRISSEGKLLWEKAFYRTRPVVDHCIGSIHDVTEAENGDLIAVGRIDNYLEYDPVVFQGRPDPDILIIRMDANGCIDPKCETITKIESTVSTTQHNETAGYTAFFFPNPSDGSMELMNHTVVTSVSVFDLNGSLVFIQADPGRSLDLTGLPPGLYIAHLTLVNGMVIKQKIVLQ